MPLSLSADEGYLEVEFKSAEGTQTVLLDLFEANNVYASLLDAHEDAAELASAWCEWLGTKGLPGLSHGAGFRVAVAIGEAKTAFAKKNGLSLLNPDLPASTDSQSADSLPPRN